MTTRVMTGSAADRRSDHYREVERALWDSFGLEPVERWVDLDQPRLRLRVLEFGTGEPLLFVHGTAGSGAWPSLVRELAGYRCIVLDRPGWGLSTPLDYDGRSYGELTAVLVDGVLEALGIRAAAVVGNSIGNVWALHAAAANPAVVTAAVLLGAGPVVPEVGVPGIIRLIASPVGALMVRLPDSRGRVRSILRSGGHGESLDAGLLDGFIDWRLALAQDTRSMIAERAMVRAIVRGNGYRAGVTFADDELASIAVPTLIVYGTADPFGGVDTWRRVAGRLPHGDLAIVDGAAHEPWIEAPGRVAREIRRFLDGRVPAAQP